MKLKRIDCEKPSQISLSRERGEGMAVWFTCRLWSVSDFRALLTSRCPIVITLPFCESVCPSTFSLSAITRTIYVGVISDFIHGIWAEEEPLSFGVTRSEVKVT